MFKSLKNALDAAVVKIARKLPRFSPNFITILGVLPPILFLWLMADRHFGWALVALLGTALDSLDGSYARATGQTTKFGAVLDSSLDRFADAIIISAFAAVHLISWSFALTLIIFSFLISYTKAASALANQDAKFLSVGPIERSQRLTLIFLALAFHLVSPGAVWAGLPGLNILLLLLLILSVGTFVRRLVRSYRLS